MRVGVGVDGKIGNIVGLYPLKMTDFTKNFSIGYTIIMTEWLTFKVFNSTLNRLCSYTAV